MALAADDQTTSTSTTSSSAKGFSTFAVSSKAFLELDWLPIAALLTNESGIIIDCNTSLTQLLGFTPADLVGFNCSKLIAGSGQSRHDKHIQTFIANTSLDAPAAKSDSSRRILGKQRSMLVQTKGSKSRLVRMVLYEFIDRDARRFLSTFVPDSTPTLTNFITCTAAASVHATISGTIVAANHAMM
jgi:PAS domain S-box-containing protein